MLDENGREIIPYSPLKKGQQDKINAIWAHYREHVGLEGLEYFKLLSQGRSEKEAQELMKIFESERKDNMPKYEEFKNLMGHLRP